MQQLSNERSSRFALKQLINSRLVNNLHNLEKLLFFLTILFLPTQLGKHFWPQSSFIFSLRIDYLSPTIYFWDLLVLGLLLVFGLKGAMESRKINLNKKFIWLLLVFFIPQILSIFISVNPQACLVRLKDLSIAALFGLYIASKNFNTLRPYFFSGLILAAVFESLLAIGEFLLNKSLGFWILGERSFNVTTPLIAKFNFYDQVFLRPYGTFSHPNLLAGFLLVSWPLILLGISERLKIFKLLLSLFLAGTILITFSRPALILGIIELVVLFRKFWRLLLILTIIVAPLALVRFFSIFNYDSLALTRRQELTEYSLKLFLDQPVFGIGLNNFINLLAEGKLLVGTSRFLQPVHNIFLLTLSETGLVGLFGFLAILGTAFWQNIKKTDLLSKILLGNLLMIIFLSLFDHYFLTLPQGQRLLFLILGLSFVKR